MISIGVLSLESQSTWFPCIFEREMYTYKCCYFLGGAFLVGLLEIRGSS
jgi:hypothetical protein